MFRTYLPVGLLVVSGLLIAILSRDSTTKASVDQESTWMLVDLPSSFSRTFGGLVSSLIWVDLVFAYSDHLLEGRSDKNLLSRAGFASRMDRSWKVPPQFVVLALPTCPDSPSFDEFREILDSGLANNQQDWRTRLFYVEHLTECGFSAQSLASVVLPLGNCSECPDWVRTYPVGFLRDVLSRSDRVSMLLEVRRSSFSDSARHTIEQRVLRIVNDARSQDRIEVGPILTRLFDALEGGLPDSQQKQIEWLISDLARDSLSRSKIEALGKMSKQL